jgi:hypothetical protein
MNFLPLVQEFKQDVQDRQDDFKALILFILDILFFRFMRVRVST